MGDNLVIAAIPDENDRVWKVSSEKIPHLTLLHLGETRKVANLEQIMLFVEHAASQSLNSFYLPVDRRGELGEEKADVLFFKKGRYDFKAINDFRNMLLQDQNIKTAYDSAPQFEGPWTPHLTLGYPATPPKPVDDDHPFYDVQFNKIAVWASDFEGPDWLLKDYWDEMEENGYDMDAPLGALAIHQLSHFGTKGMRWGSRKSETISVNGKSKQVTPKKAAKADKAWEKNIFSLPGAVEVHNVAADYFNQRIGAINDKHDVTFTDAHWADTSQKSWSPEQKAYLADVNKTQTEGTRRAVLKVHGKSPTGKLSARLSDDGSRVVVEHKASPNNLVWKSPGSGTSGFGHAATSTEKTEVLASVKLIFNARGLITGVESIDGDFNQSKEGGTMSQTTELGIEFLEHHGVRGMRWGVRNDTSNGAAGNAAKKVGGGAKKVGKGLVKGVKNVAFETAYVQEIKTREVHSTANKAFQAEDVPRINAKYKDTKGGSLKGRLLNPLHPDTRAYRNESRIAYRDQINKTVDALPTNASGTRKYQIEDNGKTNAQYGWALKAVDVKKTVTHADTSDALPLDEFNVRPVFDADGFITDVKLVKDTTLAQSAIDLGATTLSSLGIRG